MCFKQESNFSHLTEPYFPQHYLLKKINNNFSFTLKRFSLFFPILLINDVKCDAGVGVDRFFHAIYTQNHTKMVMVLGSACSEVTESLARVVPYWNMIMASSDLCKQLKLLTNFMHLVLQVSFGSLSPALSDREEFPYFFRTVMPDSAHNPARIAFIRHFKWDTVTTFSQNEEVHSLAINDLVTKLERANISCSSTLSFSDTDYKEQLQLLRVRKSFPTQLNKF